MLHWRDTFDDNRGTWKVGEVFPQHFREKLNFHNHVIVVEFTGEELEVFLKILEDFSSRRGEYAPKIVNAKDLLGYLADGWSIRMALGKDEFGKPVRFAIEKRKEVE